MISMLCKINELCKLLVLSSKDTVASIKYKKCPLLLLRLGLEEDIAVDLVLLVFVLLQLLLEVECFFLSLFVEIGWL